MKHIHKLLVANRGEIAVRILRTARDMGIATVAVYSDVDSTALFVKFADEAIALGGNLPSDTYLNQDKIISAAKQCGADAIHPGYGFLSENAFFAKRCSDEGLNFVGPSSEVIRKLGSKSEAKEIAKRAGVPVVPGYNGSDQSLGRFKYEAEEIGYPILLKASAGGGGKGMRIVNDSAALEDAFEAAKREAEKSFGDGSLLMEKYFPIAKHIEFQILGDRYGTFIHLGDRECSLQRRYQKVIEEAPSPSLSEDLRKQMGEAAVAIATAVKYTNAGTVEFLLDEDKNFYFLEVNTRLQVEHPVTEMVNMLDLVRLQIQIAEGHPIPEYIRQLEQSPMHSIECRICAEVPENNFFPATGKILVWNESDIESIRYDTGIESGSVVSSFYDSMLAKVIVVEENRAQAIRLMTRALDETVLLGVANNKDFLKTLVKHPSFVDGSFDTKLIERFYTGSVERDDNALAIAATAAVLYSWSERSTESLHAPSLNGWRNIFYQPVLVNLEFRGEAITVAYRHLGADSFDMSILDKQVHVQLNEVNNNVLTITIDNHRHTLFVVMDGNDCYLQFPSSTDYHFTFLPRFPELTAEIAKGRYVAPMPGEIVKVLVTAGEAVQSGKALVVMSSMKMETTIEAHSDAIVEEVFVTDKSFVEAGAPLLKMKED
jgi:acetyl-CoA carboxylase biotin carboxylase subunit